MVEAKAGVTFNSFEAVSFYGQVVDGDVYRVKYNVGDDKYVHAALYYPFSHTKEEP